MDAHRSGAPVLALASHIPSRQIGTGYFQETNPKPCSRRPATSARPSPTPSQVRAADPQRDPDRGGQAGRGGARCCPVTSWPAPAGSVHASATVTGRPRPAPTAGAVAELARRIGAAENITIFGGIGCADARDEVLELADRLNAPIGHTLRGKDILQYDNPYDVGMTGLLGYGACYEALHEAELVLLLGTDFPYDEFLPTADNVQVDIDPAAPRPPGPDRPGHRGRCRRDHPRRCCRRWRNETDRGFLDRMLRAHAGSVEHSVDDLQHACRASTGRSTPSTSPPSSMNWPTTTPSSPPTPVCAAPGPPATSRPNGQRRLLGSFVHGSMANALPMAIGAQVAQPGRQVISLSGDGGLAMLLGELLTVRTHRLPVKVVVFNNSSLGMVRLEMLVAGDPPFETDHDHGRLRGDRRGRRILHPAG